MEFQGSSSCSSEPKYFEHEFIFEENGWDMVAEASMTASLSSHGGHVCAFNVELYCFQSELNYQLTIMDFDRMREENKYWAKTIPN